MQEKNITLLPLEAKALWKATYSKAEPKYGSSKASQIAWHNIKSKIQNNGSSWFARTKDLLGFETSKYLFVADEASIARSNGETTVNYVIASSKSIGGISLSPIALKRLSEQINIEGLKGRVDEDKKHAYLKELQSKGLSEDEIEEELQKIDSGIKAESAYVEGNKLVARIRLAEGVTPAKAVSIEARYPLESVKEGVTDQARAVGFVFTDEPADPDAIRV